MAQSMMGMRALRSVLDDFCAGQGLPIGSSAALDVARHCLALTSVREYEELELLVELRNWYTGDRAEGQDAFVAQAVVRNVRYTN